VDDHNVNTEDFINTILVNNVPHHFSYIDVKRQDEVKELLQWLGLRAVQPVSYKKYLQC
jgi:hypothetical protein